MLTAQTNPEAMYPAIRMISLMKAEINSAVNMALP